MRIELDHLFVCAAPSAPEAERFIQLGLREAPSNRHPGQGTANRRFSFANAMIELLWVSDPGEAQSQLAKRTLLWDRWSDRHRGASPFGIRVRPADPERTVPPFPAWEYRPPYLPDPLVMHIDSRWVRGFFQYPRHKHAPERCRSRIKTSQPGCRSAIGVVEVVLSGHLPRLKGYAGALFAAGRNRGRKAA